MFCSVGNVCGSRRSCWSGGGGPWFGDGVVAGLAKEAFTNAGNYVLELTGLTLADPLRSICVAVLVSPNRDTAAAPNSSPDRY